MRALGGDDSAIDVLHSLHHSLEGALQGLGILYSYDDHRIHELLAAGRLKRVLSDCSPTLPGHFLYYPGRRDPPRALRAFIDCFSTAI